MFSQEGDIIAPLHQEQQAKLYHAEAKIEVL